MLNVHINVDRWTDGQTENRTPISHPATSRCDKKFYSSHCFLKIKIFSLFPIVKMNANYAEICSVGNLEAGFQQVLLVHFFCRIFTMLLRNISN